MSMVENTSQEKLTKKENMEGENESLLRGEQSEESNRQNYEEDKELDGGWGWIVVFACFLTTFVLDGIGYSFGIFMEPLKAELGEGNFGVASIGSIQIAVYLSSGPVVAGLVTKFGARPVCITGSLLACVGLLGASFAWNVSSLLVCYSLVTGVGFGCMYIPGVVASQEHFTKRRALATGIAVCGTGMGTLVLPPLVETAIEHHGWRWAFRILSGICMGSVMCGAAMFPAKRTQNSKPEESESSSVSTERSECKGWRWILSLIVGPSLASSDSLLLFLMVMIGDFLATMSLYIPYTHLPDMAVARGVEPRNAAFLISAAGICSTLGRVLAGLLCDQRKLHPMTITCVATGMAALQAFLLISCTQYWMFLILTSGFGLATGFWVACETPLIIRTLSFEHLTPAFGLLTAGGGVAALTGAPLAGYAVDLSKTDKGMAVVICGCIMGTSGLVYAAATVYRLYRERRVARRGYQQI